MVGVDRLESVHSPDVSMQPKNDIIYIYENKVLSVISSDARIEGRCEVARKIRNYLQSVEPKQRLPASVVDALELCIRSKECAWRPSKIAEGLRAIESFALNLWDLPWKKEFYTISVCKYNIYIF